MEFSAEDAVRSDLDFLAKIFTAVIEAGATTINIPDTVGYSIPSVWYERISNIIKSVPNGDKVVWSTTAIMTWVWRLPTRWLLFRQVCVRWNVPSTAWENVRVMPALKKL